MSSSSFDNTYEMLDQKALKMFQIIEHCDFIIINFFKNLFQEHYQCQTVWIRIRTNRKLVLIWIQTVCKGYQQQGSHRLEKYLNLDGFLEKSLKTKSALKSTGKSLICLEKSLNSTIFCRTWHS